MKLIILIMMGSFGLSGCDPIWSYPLSAKIDNSSLPDNGKVVFAMLGDSQMVGQGVLEPYPHDPHVTMFAYDGKWKTAYEPTSDPSNLAYPDMNNGAHFSCGTSFGKEIRRHSPSLEVGLIPDARNGSTLRIWHYGVYGFYNTVIKRIHDAMGRKPLAGIIIHLGTNDSAPSADEPDWTDWSANFTDFIRQLRFDLNQPNLPIIFAQIGKNGAPSVMVHHDEVAALQAQVNIPHVKMIKTDDLPLLPDGTHLSTEGEEELGRRFAASFSGLL